MRGVRDKTHKLVTEQLEWLLDRARQGEITLGDLYYETRSSPGTVVHAVLTYLENEENK